MAIGTAEDGTLEAGWSLVAWTEAQEGWNALRGGAFVDMVEGG